MKKLTNGFQPYLSKPDIVALPCNLEEERLQKNKDTDKMPSKQ